MTNAELYVTAMNEQARLVTNTPAYLKLMLLLIPVPGVGPSTYDLLEAGDEGTAVLLNKLEGMEVQIGEEVSIKAPEILENLTIATNLSCGFSREEYVQLVRYVVEAIQRSKKSMGSSSESRTGTMMNEEGENIVDIIFEYPQILTLLLMEGQAFEIVKEA